MMARTNRRPVAVIASFNAEIKHIVGGISNVRQSLDGIWNTYEWEIEGLPVVVVRCGVGMVAAAAAAEHCIATYTPQSVINFGSAGAQVRDIFPGDVVIGERVIAYSTLQVLTSGEELHIDRWIPAIGEDSPLPRSVVQSAPDLVAEASRVAQGWTPDPWPFRSSTSYQPDRPPVVRSGVVISADIWVQSTDRIDQLHKRHDSLVADMEAAAIGQVAAIHDVPFLTIKDISSNEFYRSTFIDKGLVRLPADEHGKRAAVLVSRLLASLATAVVPTSTSEPDPQSE